MLFRSGLVAGMDDFVTKPADPAALFSTLLKWLSSRTGEGSASGA